MFLLKVKQFDEIIQEEARLQAKAQADALI